MIDGKITNFKLVVRDLDSSLAFYTGLFGMKVGARLDFTDPAVTEVILENADGSRTLVLLHGDVMPPPQRIPGYAPLVVEVDDIEQARAEIVKAGYAVHVEPISFGPVSLLMVADPDGYIVEIVSGDADAFVSPPEGVTLPHPIPQIHAR